jgi:hypothetical protein
MLQQALRALAFQLSALMIESALTIRLPQHDHCQACGVDQGLLLVCLFACLLSHFLISYWLRTTRE